MNRTQTGQQGLSTGLSHSCRELLGKLVTVEPVHFPRPETVRHVEGNETLKTATIL